VHCAALHIAFINANFFQGSGHGPIDFIVASGASIKDIPAQGGYQNRDILEHGGVNIKRTSPKLLSLKLTFSSAHTLIIFKMFRVDFETVEHCVEFCDLKTISFRKTHF